VDFPRGKGSTPCEPISLFEGPFIYKIPTCDRGNPGLAGTDWWVVRISGIDTLMAGAPYGMAEKPNFIQERLDVLRGVAASTNLVTFASMSSTTSALKMEQIGPRIRILAAKVCDAAAGGVMMAFRGQGLVIIVATTPSPNVAACRGLDIGGRRLHVHRGEP
jgi:hypothetical protein